MQKKDCSPEGVSDAACLTGLEQAEQRKYRRFSTNFAARIHWTDGAGNLRNTSGTIIDVSAEGFGIELARPFPKGTLLSIETQEGVVECVVRHVRKHPTSGRLGVEVLSWTEKWRVGRY